MAKVDPKAREEERKEKGWDTPRADRLTEEGRFLLSPVGFELFEQPNEQQTPGLLVRFVVLDAGPNFGKVIERRFWRTPKAMGAIADLSLAMGYDSPWDCDREDDIKKVLQHGSRVFSGTVKGDSYTDRDGNDRESFEVAFFNAHRRPFEWTDEQKAARSSAIVDWKSYLEWRKSNPRGENRRSGGGSGGGGGRSSHEEQDQGGGEEWGDIPF